MYHERSAVTTTDSTLHNMAGSSLGPLLHVASVLLFLAGMASLIVSLGHLGSRQQDSDNHKRRVVRSLERLHPEDVEALYLQGIFSALINATIESSDNEALLILLPALEKFENVMVEESRKIRTALKDHNSRIQYLEEFISRQGDEDVQNTQEIQPIEVEERKARIKVKHTKAQNEVLKSKIKHKKELVLKETVRRGDVDIDVEIERNETLIGVLHNDSVVVEEVKSKTPLKKDLPVNNDTVVISDNSTLVFGDTLIKTDSRLESEGVGRNETEISSVTASTSIVNETDSFLLGNSSDVVNTTAVTNTSVPTPDTMYNDSSTSYPDNTTVDVLTATTQTTTQQPTTTHTVAKTTTSTIRPTILPTKESPSLEETVSQLQEKVSRLENFRVKSGTGKWNSYKRKMKVLEKNIAEMKRRYRKMKTRLNSHTSKISGIEILQSVAYSDMPRNIMQEYEAKKAMVLRFDKIDRRMTNYRDMVIRNRHEIRDLKGLTTKQEHYISELQAGSDRFEHKGRELTATIHGLEATIGNLFNSLNGYMSDMRWELRVMLDRVCGDNHLHC